MAASVECVYQALTTRDAVQSWLPPTGARGVIHEFEPRAGGLFRLTLTFETTGATGTRKSSSNTDVVDGEFSELLPNRLIRQCFKFNSEDPAFDGVMAMTWKLSPTAAGTHVEVVAEDVPAGIKREDHEAGMASSLANLAKYVEQRPT